MANGDSYALVTGAPRSVADAEALHPERDRHRPIHVSVAHRHVAVEQFDVALEPTRCGEHDTRRRLDALGQRCRCRHDARRGAQHVVDVVESTVLDVHGVATLVASVGHHDAVGIGVTGEVEFGHQMPTAVAQIRCHRLRQRTDPRVVHVSGAAEAPVVAATTRQVEREHLEPLRLLGATTDRSSRPACPALPQRGRRSRTGPRQRGRAPSRPGRRAHERRGRRRSRR